MFISWLFSMRPRQMLTFVDICKAQLAIMEKRASPKTLTFPDI
jgi:hypothetical protein